METASGGSRTATETRTVRERLNPSQRDAVTHEGGPLLVIAGAGTGKTAVITERIAFLIRERGYRPDDILALTFTGKAASEMEERVDRLLPMGYSRVWIETFHGCCERMLRDSALEIGLDPAFRLLSVPQQWLLLRRHLDELPLKYFRPLGNPTKFLRALVRTIAAAKDQDIPPEKFETYARGQEERAESAAEASARDALREDGARWREFAAAYRAYNALLLRKSAMDFGDLILNTLHLFRERPTIRERYRTQFREILVDEYQDTNVAQNELLNLLVGDRGNITVVGDDDQSIYAWRGSNITNILGFQRTYPTARHIVLTENYRSPQPILNAAYELIQHNTPYRLENSAGVSKRLTSPRSEASHPPLVHRRFATIEQETKFIAESIAGFAAEGTYEYRDCAILLRTNAQADEIVPFLVQRDLPYVVADARGLLLRPEVRDVASYLRAVADPTNTVALFRVLSLPIFGVAPFERQRLVAEARRANRYVREMIRDAAALSFLSQESREGLRKITALLEKDVARAATALPSRMLFEFLEASGYLSDLLRNDRLAAEAVPNLTEFLNFVSEYERGDPDASLLSFVDFLDLVVASGESPAQAMLPADVDAIRLLTVHGAKGLEFPVVFIPGATRDKYPIRDRSEPLELPDAFAPQQDLDPRDAHIFEERRLFYVAMTRARDRLFITSAERSGSQKTARKPSPFIEESGLVSVGGGEAALKEQLLLPLRETPPVAATRPLVTVTTISASQAEAYETCPLKYQFQYVYRVPTPPSHALTFGTTVHAVLRDLARLVLAGKTTTGNDALALYEKHWSSEGYHGKNHEERYKVHGQKLLTAYLEAHPELLTARPLFIEEPFRFRLGDVTVVGRIDRVDRTTEGAIAVTDFKTGTARSSRDAEESLQLTVYALALREVFHLHADRLTLSYLEGNVDRQVTRSAEDLAEAEKRLLRIAARIRAGEFTATPGYLACRFCDFRTICDSSVV